jgi:DNA-binding NarL/FixJ family response regulator
MAEVTRVLIVDDDELFREALGIFLAEMPGVTLVGAAADGFAALALARSTRPDVILLDVEMPGLDGFETTRLLREDPEPPRIVICTAASRPGLDREAREAGADAVIYKGRIEEFERALEAAVGCAPPRGSRLARRARADEQAQQNRQHD